MEILNSDIYALEKNNFQAIVLAHVKKYPRMKIQDLYKLCYQAAMGNSHLGFNQQQLLNKLQAELQPLTPNSDEILVEPLSPDRKVIRLHLRPFKALSASPEELSTAIFCTAQRFQPSLTNLVRWWQFIEMMVIQPEFTFKLEALRDFLAQMQQQGFPVKHHSATYRKNYQPAYRVILSELIPQSLRLSTLTESKQQGFPVNLRRVRNND